MRQAAGHIVVIAKLRSHLGRWETMGSGGNGDGIDAMSMRMDGDGDELTLVRF